MLTLRRSTPFVAVVALALVVVASQREMLASGAADAAALGPNLLTNGTFAAGTTRWATFGSPADALEFRVRNGVFEWNRTGDASSQAVVFQNAGAVPVTPLEASFDLGNSANIRQRVSVVVADADFGDLSLCTFWIEPGAPLRTYRMRSHTNEPWTSATISFYAATTASGAVNGGLLRLDNVSLATNSTGSDTRTDCVDPTTPPPAGGLESGSLVVNGEFNLALNFWQTFGNMTSFVAGGVFNFIRHPGQPAGVILQHTGAGVAPNEFLTARFDLGNSSQVRKRVTAVVHASDFSDLAACPFWLSPGQPRLTYVMRMRATRGWPAGPTGATVSFYGAVGSEPWIELDNVRLTRTPGAAIQGTECIEPVVLFGASPAASAETPADAARPAGVAGRTRHAFATDAAGEMTWMADPAAPIDVQVSRDGEHWETLARVPAGEDWTAIELDLRAFDGEPVQIRLIYASVAPASASRAISLWIRRR